MVPLTPFLSKKTICCLPKTSHGRRCGVYPLFHILIIASSNYLVQLPIEILGVHTTWGAFSFRLFSWQRISLCGFWVHYWRVVLFCVRCYRPCCSHIYYRCCLMPVNFGVAQIAQFDLFCSADCLCKFMAYLLGQILDISVFGKLRQLPQWWIAPVASTIIGNMLDTVAFLASRSIKPQIHLWPALGGNCGGRLCRVKLLISIGLFVPAYGVLLRYLTRKLFGQTTVNWQTVWTDDAKDQVFWHHLCVFLALQFFSTLT